MSDNYINGKIKEDRLKTSSIHSKFFFLQSSNAKPIFQDGVQLDKLKNNIE